jgi:hypothetical protein
VFQTAVLEVAKISYSDGLIESAVKSDKLWAGGRESTYTGAADVARALSPISKCDSGDI